DVVELTLAQGAWMAVLAGKAAGFDEGRALCEGAIRSGRALELFLENVRLQGGDAAKLLADRGKRRSPHRAELRAERSGFVAGIDAYAIGLAGVHLGVGRNRTDEAVCPEAGMTLHRKKGEAIREGDLLIELYGKDEASLGPALELARGAVRYADDRPADAPLILKEITAL
ncbi:MAG TPA: thymidine phosphorylase, partial [Treponemataceae bacterium]|nr:thymidine phosphorylase [Treponemataceae bacterium]